MFQFFLAEVAYAQGHGVFPCAIYSYVVIKGKDGVPQKDKFERFLDLVAHLRICEWVGYPFCCNCLLMVFAYV